MSTEARPDRSDTERRMEEAAIRLIRRNGVLAGLNLREVADEAGVTRGLVYHHFGSRRSLLRSALRNSSVPRRRNIVARGRLSPQQRLSDFLHRTIKDPISIQLLTLLILDGDEGVVGLPFQDVTRKTYARDIEAGVLDDDIPVAAQIAGVAAAVFGYALYRRSFALSLGVDARELDHGVERLFHRLKVNPDR